MPSDPPCLVFGPGRKRVRCLTLALVLDTPCATLCRLPRHGDTLLIMLQRLSSPLTEWLCPPSNMLSRLPGKLHEH